LIVLPPASFLALAILIYCLYFSVAFLFFLVGLLLVSDNIAKDSRLAILVPIFPIFMLALRIWGVVCTLNEVFRRGHEESSMAPWWVLKRGRRF